MASFMIKIFFVFTAMTLLSSCSNKEDAILGGKYHGLKTIGVEYGYANHGELLKVNPDFIIQSPLQILECLSLFPD